MDPVQAIALKVADIEATCARALRAASRVRAKAMVKP